jgi:hypothetical protein
MSSFPRIERIIAFLAPQLALARAKAKLLAAHDEPRSDRVAAVYHSRTALRRRAWVNPVTGRARPWL